MLTDNHNEKLIGLIIGGISNEFSKEIIKGVLGAIPSKNDVRLVILPGELMVESFQGKVVSAHDSMFNSIYDLGRICKMDGLIIAMGSIGWRLSEEKTREFLKQYEGIPTVLIASGFEDYTTVNYDNKMGINEAISFLVGNRGFNRIGMIGGYDANIDSRRRKSIFIECIEENGLEFSEKMYEASDMSENSEEAAKKLLDNNPDIQAIFCVNDATAVGVYNVLKSRRIQPGRDIVVFGFDNTRSACEMNPKLSSIGSASVTLGQRALELLLKKINGHEVSSEFIPTRLYGRQSLPYESYEYSYRDVIDSSEQSINKMFDDCFYRYSNECISREDVNLRRLFYEIISRMFDSVVKRYMGNDEFEELGSLIDIFFENKAMEYTDTWKFLDSVRKLQNGINRHLIGKENTLVNRLFLRMKDDAIFSISEMKDRDDKENILFRTRMRQFVIRCMDYENDPDKKKSEILNSLKNLGIQNAALYLFEEPVRKDENQPVKFPDKINLQSVIKYGEIYMIPKQKQERPLSEIFTQREIRVYNRRFVTFPIFYENYFYGLFLCEHSEEVYHRGEVIASLLGVEYGILRKS